MEKILQSLEASGLTITQKIENLINEDLGKREATFNVTKEHFFIRDYKVINVPTRASRALDYLPKKALKQIHEDIDLAKELCLVFLSFLSDTYYTSTFATNAAKRDGWKQLNSSILQDALMIKGDDSLYKKVIDVLEVGTTKGPIIDVDKSYLEGEYSRSYKLADKYLNRGVNSYTLQHKSVKTSRERSYYRMLSNAIGGKISSNMIHVYAKLEKPTLEQVKEEAKRLVAEGYRTNKGRKLVFENKRSKQYHKERNNAVVEDHIEMFQYLTSNGYMIPVESDKAGGRVADSLTLMPGWIRNLFKIDGKPLMDPDFVCLHPNLTMTIYGGKTEYITHDKVADTLGVDRQVAKVEHLSFFNKSWDQMMKSPLFDYYISTEANVMQKLFEEKRDGIMTHNKLFRMESTLMANVIERLNEMDIYVVYVYDALKCHPDHHSIVVDIMNEEAIKMNVKTVAK